VTTAPIQRPGRLERRLRRLLMAYPPGPRREELLDTIMEGEEGAPRRRSVRQALNLLRHGMRARLGHPRSHAVVVIATLVTLLTGLFGVAAVAPLGWALAPSLPQGAASDELKREVFPGLTAWGGGDAARWVPTGDGEGRQYGFAYYWAQATTATRDVAGYTNQARDRLAAQGWTIRGDVEVADSPPDQAPPASRSATFWATRDSLILHFDDEAYEKAAAWDSEGFVAFTLSRSAPPALWLIVLAGGLIAALLGWLTTGWVARRVEGRRLLRTVTVLSVAIGLLISLPLVAFVMLNSIPDDSPRTADEVFFLGVRGLLGLWQPALLFVGVMLLLAVMPRRGEWKRPVRVMAVGAALVALAAVWFADRAPRLVENARRTASHDSCVLATPAWNTAAGDRLSYTSRVFIRPQTSADQRNLIQAAISRIPGTRGFNFNYDPSSQAYRDAYCNGAPLPAGAGADLPYFWDVDLSSPGVLPGLAAEVGTMPGVVAVEPS
jgi:hypothetical protein